MIFMSSYDRALEKERAVLYVWDAWHPFSHHPGTLQWIENNPYCISKYVIELFPYHISHAWMC